MLNSLFEDVRGMHLLVALSGGADSVALLVLLCERAKALQLRLTCAHIEHGIRAEESLCDAKFCEELCRNMNVALRVIHVDVPSQAMQTGEGIETVARRMRYEALERLRIELQADRIALAHHLNDQAETVLMHLLRGCGGKGAGGMQKDDGRLYRPLLQIPKKDLEQYLLQKGFTWRTDSTNRIADTPRNVLRLNVIPELEKIYPNAQAAISRFAECMQTEGSFLESAVDDFLKNHFECGLYGMRILSPEKVHEAVFRRAVVRVFPETLDYNHLIAVAKLAQQVRGRCELTENWFAERTPLAVYFLRKQTEKPIPVSLSVNGTTVFSPLGEMEASQAEPKPLAEPFRQVLRMDALEGAVLRTRCEGDRFRPLGCGEKSLSDFMIDRKIDRPMRDCVPLVARGNKVLWVVGYAISEDVKLISSKDRAVMLCWKSYNIGGNERE